jgi:serine/threonine-protein kinase
MSRDDSQTRVIALFDGASVEDLAEARGGKLPIPIAVAVVVQMLDVLAAAHAAGIVHREVKPANLFVTRAGVVKVLDFGIARRRDLAAGITAAQSAVALGTPAFMSPEQAMGKSQLVDAQSDVWASGATLFTLVSGELVHQTESPAELVVRAATRSARSLALATRDAPIELVSVIDRALAFDKDARWGSAAELRDALLEGYRKAFGAEPPTSAELAAFLESLAPRRVSGIDLEAPPTLPTGGGTTGVPVENDPAEAPSARRNRKALAVAGLTAVVAIGGVVVMLQAARHPATSAPAAMPPSVVAGPPASPGGASVRPRATSPPPTSPTPTAPRRAPAVDCNPDYTLDAEGNKHFKPECFLE